MTSTTVVSKEVKVCSVEGCWLQQDISNEKCECGSKTFMMALITKFSKKEAAEWNTEASLFEDDLYGS